VRFLKLVKSTGFITTEDRMSSNPYQTPSSPPQNPGSNFQVDSARLGIKQVLFSFTGRIPRRTYWLWRIVSMFVFIVIFSLISPLLAMQSEGDSEPEISSGVAILLVVLAIPLIWIALSLQVKRWHDRDKSGMWIFISMIPIVGPIWSFIECGCLPGTPGPNSYGPDPS
jgi:uncharacterized membrane protein YhaH (DUF805 family)